MPARRVPFRLLAPLLLAAVAAAQAAAPAPTTTSLPSGTRVNAELKTKLDTQHAKVGDHVVAVSTAAVKAGRTVLLPKGATFTGQVVAVVAAESRKSPSRISILFDQATSKQGGPISLRAAIAALAPSDSPNLSADPGMGMPSPRSMPSSDTGTSGTSPMQRGSLGDQPVPPVVTASVPAGGGNANGGVVRIQLAPQAAGSTLSAPEGNLKLDSGTRIVLLVQQ